ncbi:MAG: NAD(P)H-hydrate dehydratase [Clostridia bacterium]|nr:NAD(P)H-hydrate dehydratase [Clostridia bacterium]
MQKILTAHEMKEADQNTIHQGTASLVLMERAAKAVFDVLLAEFPTEKVLVCCGSGNNGGDGFALARLLLEHGIDTTITYLGQWNEKGEPDATSMSLECAAEFKKLPKSIHIKKTPSLTGVSTVVDAIFGIGLSRPLTGTFLEAARAINASKLPVLAIDIPSGVHADNGQVLGGAVRATKTVAIAAKKYGHLLFPGADLSGEVTVTDIGIHATSAHGHLLEKCDLEALPTRPRRAHKGTFGRVLVVGGSKSMSGAALLAAKAAYRAGAGLVEIVTPEENRLVYEIALPEAIVTTYTKENAALILDKSLTRADSVALGMGLSTDETARALVDTVLNSKEIPLVIDADALNLIAKDNALRAKMYLRGHTVLTPHPMELSRLMAIPVSAVLDDMPKAAETFSKDSGALVVLKDAHTVIADGDRLYFNTFGNSGMATGGCGDVLAGIIATMAVRAPLDIAATRGVLAHALAGDAAKRICGETGLMACDVVDGLRVILP